MYAYYHCHRLFLSIFIVVLNINKQVHSIPTTQPCSFDSASIYNIEKWWKGEQRDLFSVDLRCVSKSIGKMGGGAAGAAGGSIFGAWLGRKVGSVIGFGDTGEKIGKMYGFNYGLHKGAEIGEQLGETWNLAALLGRGNNHSGTGSGNKYNERTGSKQEQKYSRHHKSDTKLQMRDKCYKTMDLTKRSTRSEIKASYRRAAREAHPDKHGGKHDHMVQLNLCYEIILLANTGSTSRN
jgi:hypothetical protein